jgi:RNA polymerase sigma-70 factor (ECF subfamily)
MPLASFRDEDVMREVARGDESALDILMRRHANSLLTFIGRMIGNRHMAEELFQESFLAVWTHRRSYKYPNSFRSWLFGISVNKCRGAFRKHTSTAVPMAEAVAALVSPGLAPEDQAVAAETSSQVQQALLTLPERQRTVVVLRIWNGLSYFEIGSALNCGEATARTHMFHGLAALRRTLEPQLR